MPNPTGTTYLTANPAYVWTEGDVYEIVQTDQQEGAALDASFNGLGVDNQPHQVLLNKIELVHTKQANDEIAIASLAAFQALLTGLAGTNGYLKIPYQDISRGQQVMLVQWGVYNPPGGVTGDTLYAVPWTVTFPNAVYWAGATMQYSRSGAVSTKDLGVGVYSLAASAGNFYVNLFNVNGVVDGFWWIAIGY